jgi:hypothetical protein
MTGYVFQDDDRIVDNKSSRDGQSHERKNVQAITEQVHRGESADDRDRHRDEWDHGRAHVAQEQINDQRHQHDGDRQSKLGVTQRLADRDAAIDGDGDVDVGRHRCFEMRQRRFHAIDRLNDISARLTE